MVIGLLNWLIIVTSFIGVMFLFAAAGFAIRYTKTFYGDRPVPRSWMLIVIGLLANAIAETGELGVFGEVLLLNTMPGIPEGMIELAAHAIGGIALGAGAYMLWKEMP